MKSFKFILSLAVAYVATAIFILGLDALWTMIMSLGGLYAFLVAVSVFCILPGLVMACIVFKW